MWWAVVESVMSFQVTLHKMQIIYRQADKVITSQEGLQFVELVSKLVFQLIVYIIINQSLRKSGLPQQTWRRESL